MSSYPEIRRQAMASIIEAMAEAEAQGQDAFAAGRRMFSEVPIEIIAEASVEIDARKVEAWWQSVEKTIDGEIIRRAIGGPAEGEP